MDDYKGKLELRAAELRALWAVDNGAAIRRRTDTDLAPVDVDLTRGRLARLWGRLVSFFHAPGASR